jgi:hypothetical protein
MSTQPVAQPTQIHTQPEYTTITKDVAFGWLTNDKGKKEGAVFVDLAEAEEATKAGKFEGNVITTKITLPVNFAAVAEYANKEYKDEKGETRDINEVLTDLVTLFRPGMQAKARNRMTQRLLDTDEAGNFTFGEKDLTDGILDLTSEITSPSKRVFLTEEQKTWKNLSALPKEVRENMWKVYLTSIGKEYYLPTE